MTIDYSNTNYKDSVFIKYLSSSDAGLVELYNAIKGTNYPLDTKVEKNTLTDVLYKDRVNDLSFTLDGNTLVLFEHQSTINENMPLRILIYIAKLYEKQIRTNPEVSIYQRKVIPLPTPEFVVLYNGREEMPEHKTYYLSDAYMVADENPALELQVEVYNINYSETSELLNKSDYLKDYSYFIHKVLEERDNGKILSEAIRLAAEHCIANDVMPEFLLEHASEVEQMLVTEWDWDECIKVERKEGYEEGIATGISYGGELKEREMIRAFADLLTPEQIAEKIKQPLSYVLEVLADEPQNL